MPRISYLCRLAPLLLLLVACNQVKSQAEGDHCVCPKIYQPVCGVDAQTYGNECLAQCQGVQEWEQGRCDSNKQQDQQSCICTMEFAPVCGDDGRTYSNACKAECHGVSYQPGECAKEKSY